MKEEDSEYTKASIASFLTQIEGLNIFDIRKVLADDVNAIIFHHARQNENMPPLIIYY